jgi:hypothetical protein
MVRVGRPATIVNVIGPTLPLDLLCTTVVAMLAQTDQRTRPELHRITTVRLSMMCNRGLRYAAAVSAPFAQWLSAQLRLPSVQAPARAGVPGVIGPVRHQHFLCGDTVRCRQHSAT